jgi:hypothetical protein
MYLCYVDESGNTGNNLNDVHQPFLVLTALIVPPDCIKPIENDMRSLSYKYFGENSLKTDFEFHGAHIYSGKKPYFNQIELKQRFSIFDELVDILLKYEDVKVGYVAMKKNKYFANQHIQRCGFELLIEKLELFMQRIEVHCLTTPHF